MGIFEEIVTFLWAVTLHWWTNTSFGSDFLSRVATQVRMSEYFFLVTNISDGLEILSIDDSLQRKLRISCKKIIIY